MQQQLKERNRTQRWKQDGIYQKMPQLENFELVINQVGDFAVLWKLPLFCIFCRGRLADASRKAEKTMLSKNLSILVWVFVTLKIRMRQLSIMLGTENFAVLQSLKTHFCILCREGQMMHQDRQGKIGQRTWAWICIHNKEIRDKIWFRTTVNDEYTYIYILSKKTQLMNQERQVREVLKKRPFL